MSTGKFCQSCSRELTQNGTDFGMYCNEPSCRLAYQTQAFPQSWLLPPHMTASETQEGGTHYKDFAIQPSEFIHRNGLGWCEGNAVKYLVRHKKKNGAEDIKKAIHYLNLLLEWEYPNV